MNEGTKTVCFLSLENLVQVDRLPGESDEAVEKKAREKLNAMIAEGQCLVFSIVDESEELVS